MMRGKWGAWVVVLGGVILGIGVLAVRLEGAKAEARERFEQMGVRVMEGRGEQVIEGEVEGDFAYVGDVLRIEGKVGGTVYFRGRRLEMGEEAEVGGLNVVCAYLVKGAGSVRRIEGSFQSR